MGHQISKQQNQQMSDDQRMTSSIEAHTDPSTSPNDLQQVKISKNTRLFTSNGKKSKKQQQQAIQRSSDVSSKIKAKAKSKLKSTNTKKSSIENAVDAATASSQERNSAGSVVITIRLLKMESSHCGFDMNTVGNELTQIDNYSNNNNTNSSDSSSSSSNNNNNNQTIRAYDASMPEHSAQRQNFNFNMEQNDVRQMEGSAALASANSERYDNGNNSGMNSVKKSHVTRVLHSKATVCDNVPMNCTSQIEQQQQQLNNSLAHTFSEIRLNEPITPSAPPTTDQQPTKSAKNAFIPSNLIGTVSPYPHHIPIANIIRSDCFNGIVDEQSTLCQHAKNGGGNDVIKQNGASKESKELKPKKPNWGIKLNCTKLKGIKSLSSSLSSEPSSPSVPKSPTAPNDSDNISAENNATITTTVPAQQSTALLCTSGGNVIIVTTDQQQQWFASDEYSIEDCDKKAHLQRAIEIAENVEPASSGFISTSNLKSLHSMSTSNLPLLPGTVANVGNDPNARNAVSKTSVSSPHWTMVCSNNPSLRIIVPSAHLLPRAEDMSRIHSQVDYIHCLVPDLMSIFKSSFYWGKMDRYEAERLLDNKSEGTFLLRDSAQEDYLFSVSFRKYGRSLHARIEQFNHKFSFDCHDSSVYTSRTVTGLLEHYKDPGCVMFFEPALTIPLNRNFVFSLQQLCRATIVNHTTYDGINEICLPKKLKSYLKEYHYRQHVRVKRFDEPIYGTS